jgi:hypothetical protein
MKSKLLSIIIPVLFAVFILTGCTSGVTWSWNPYRGNTHRIETIRWVNPSVSFAMIGRHLISRGFKVKDFSGELYVATFYYQFAGTEQWNGANKVMDKYVEPVATGLIPNAFGRNAWVEVTASVQTDKNKNPIIEFDFTFKTFGEAGGLGGAGPYPMNSKGVFEKEFIDDIKNSNLLIDADVNSHSGLKKQSAY